jgi:hypothetical protein
MSFMTENRARLALVGAAATSALAVPHYAEACSANPGGHYYAEIYKPNAVNATNGAAIYMYTNSLTAANAYNFVNHEMWYGVTGNGAYWVEVGFKDGVTCHSAPSAAGPCSGSAPVHRAVFWADNRYGGGYHEHYPAVGWSENVYYQLQVDWAGVSCAWNVYLGVTHLGTSTHNCAGPTRWLAAGIEATSAAPTQHVGGYMTGWEEKARNNGWYRGWENPGLWADCPADIRSFGFYTEEVLHGPI